MSSSRKTGIREKRRKPRNERISRKAANPYDRLAKLRGKVEFSIDLDTMRYDRS